MELAWDVDVFARHATCVLRRRMCRLNSFGLGRIHKLTRPFFWGELFRESDSNFHINTHKHREWRGARAGARGGVLKAERGAALGEFDVCRMDGKHDWQIFLCLL